MRGRTARLSGAIAMLSCALVSARAQTKELDTLRVELKCDECGPAPELALELTDIQTHQRATSTELQGDGSFVLRHVPYGDYSLQILDRGGNQVHEQFISVSSNEMPISIRLSLPARRHAPGGPVSVAELQHPPSRKAFQAVLAAQRFSQAGDYVHAAEELEKAVKLSPYYADAYTNLSAQYLRLGRYQDAAGESARAIEIGGPNALALVNLASAQYGMRHLGDATESARAALRLQPDFPQAHFLLGIVLTADMRTVREGLEHLRKAAGTIPRAQAQLDRVQQALAQSTH